MGRIGSGEVIVCKVSGIKIRYCTFLDLANRGNSPVTGGAYPAQYVQQRQGQGLEVRSCWFENMTAGALKMFDDTRITGLGASDVPRDRKSLRRQPGSMAWGRQWRGSGPAVLSRRSLRAGDREHA